MRSIIFYIEFVVGIGLLYLHFGFIHDFLVLVLYFLILAL
jgi:hypothetical protein